VGSAREASAARIILKCIDPAGPSNLPGQSFLPSLPRSGSLQMPTHKPSQHVAQVRKRETATIADTLQAIRAELAWSDTATALGVVARSASPVLDLCRLLVEAGCDPVTPLEAWRGGTLCLRVGTIGIAARLEINSKGTGFIAARDVRTAPPMRANGWGRP
jgi:hypothetical protein